MGARFRKRINLGGGVKLNLNGKSASISAGLPGARVTYNTKGQRTTSVGAPGTGVSYRATKKVSGGIQGSSGSAGGRREELTGSRAVPPPPSTPHRLPTSTDEKAFSKVVAKSVKKPDVLRQWLNHAELGEAATIFMGLRFYAAGNFNEADARFSAVLCGPASETSAGFFARHPANLPLELMGVQISIVLGRGAAAVLLATICNSRHEWSRGEAAIAHAAPSDLVTALQAMFAFNLEKFDEVVHITRWCSGATYDPMETLALILRGCAFRELGKLSDARTALQAAIGGVVRCPSLSPLHSFELGRTYAVTPHGAAAARTYYSQVHRINPNYPGLEEALAELPG